MKPLVSIIIPVYNVEKYLPKCLKSVAEQTYKNLEIFLVDDGSTDKSGMICDTFARNDKRIIVNHKSNAGVSAARNWALDQAKGEYILFIDSDDWIADTLVEYTVKTAIIQEADIVMYSYLRIHTGEEQPDVMPHAPISFDDMMTTDLLVQNIITNTWPNYTWQALYKRTIWKTQRFPVEYTWLEDLRILPTVYLAARKIVYLKNTLYYYNQMNSISLTKTHEATYWNTRKRYIFFPISLEHLSLAKKANHIEAAKILTIKTIQLGIKLYWRNYHSPQPLTPEECAKIRKFLIDYGTEDIKKELKPKAKLFMWSIIHHPILCKWYSFIRYYTKRK